MTDNKKTGYMYEDIAAHFLQELGYKILYRNYRCKIGEIDIIAEDMNTLVFCEVKFRSSLKYGFPEEAVDIRKQNKIRSCTRFFLMEHKISPDTNIRFDVISVLGTKITHIKDAF